MWATYLVRISTDFGSSFQIEVPARKRHTALIKLCNDVGCIVEIRLRAKSEQRRIGFGISGIPGAGNRAMEIGHYLNHLGLTAHGVDPLQLRPQGGEGVRISLFLIRARRPVITDLLLDRRTLIGWLGRYFEYRLVEEGLVPQLKLPEGVPEDFIRRYGIVGDPAVARVLIKIGARID